MSNAEANKLGEYKTEQEEFWANEFGNEYTQRNTGAAMLASNLSFFSDILKHCTKVNTLIEFGANKGMNMRALKALLPSAHFTGIEINKGAAEEMSKIDGINVVNESVLDFEPNAQYDLVLSKGFLIHINPEHLQSVYKKMVQASSRYILIAEYYNPVPVSIPYRGHDDRLFKRDFAGEIMDIFSDVRLVNYGFAYHKATLFPQDDINWFLLERF